MRRHLAGDGHCRRPAADRAHGHGGLAAGRVDQLQDDDHDDHDVGLVVERRILVGDGLLGGEFLGHVRVVGRDVERRRNGLERHERFRLERRLRTDRWGASPPSGATGGGNSGSGSGSGTGSGGTGLP